MRISSTDSNTGYIVPAITHILYNSGQKDTVDGGFVAAFQLYQ